MKKRLLNLVNKITAGPLQPLAYVAFYVISRIQYFFYNFIYALGGSRKPNKEEIEFVRSNVTFMYKSFERQKMAKRLYKNIQSYYPGAKVVIADDSSSTLEIDDEYAEIVRLPFNSGVSAGLNRALNRIETPFLLKLDDDELLTRRTRVCEQLRFLKEHSQVDLVGFCPLTAILCKNPKKHFFSGYSRYSMNEAPKPLLIPHMTYIDDTHIIMGKITNNFLARTESLKKVAWDDNIRVIDHHEFFRRAAGVLVSAEATDTVVFHYHNMFDRNYQSYRQNLRNDIVYIRAKQMLEQKNKK